MRTTSLLLALSVLSLPASAADLFVPTGGSIQAAIASAQSGDRVLVSPGTYVEQLDLLGKDLQVIGLLGPTQTVLDGGGAAPVVRFANGEPASTTLQGFTVTNGHASFGAGGIVCAAGATPTLLDCIVTANTGKFGGGVSGSPTLRRCAVVGNTASLTHGGGLYGAPSLFHCVVANNRATSADGGGLYLVGGTAHLADCVVVENGAIFANSSGGGVYVDSTATATIERTLIVSNGATGGVFVGRGGGVYAEANTLLLDRCTVVGNSVTGSSTQGAGIFGAADLVNSIVRDNVGGSQVDGLHSLAWSDVSGGATGIGVVDLVPGFVDVATRDFHLDHGSPCIDLGDPAAFDPDGTRADLGAFPFETLYSRANAQPDTWADPSWPELSGIVGGRDVLVSLAGAASAGQAFWTLGTTAGTVPGFGWLGVVVPLNPSAYLNVTAFQPNSSVLANSLALLDGDGRAETVFTLPPNHLGPFVGLTAHHATLADGPGVGLDPVVLGPKATVVVP